MLHYCSYTDVQTADHFSADSPTVYFDRDFNSPSAKIGPGGYYVSKRNMMIVTVLGSCVSACLHDPVAKIGGMNHFMLPEKGGDPNLQLSTSSRYGAYAMEMLINRLLALGAERHRLQAKVFGAGRMLNGMTDIGKHNAEFAMNYLKCERIKVVASDLGDTYARKVYFFVQTGRVLMKELRRLNNETIFVRENSYARRLDAVPVRGEVDLF